MAWAGDSPGDLAAGSAPAWCYHALPKAQSPPCHTQPTPGAGPRCLERSLFCELWKDFRCQGWGLSVRINAAGTQGIRS